MEKEIEIKDIFVKDNIRTRIDESDVSDLMLDIKQKGLLQPVGVAQEGKKYEMLYGNRRLQACKKLGYSTINAKVFKGPLTKVQKIAINASENIHREDVSPYEFARAANNLLKEGLNKTEVAIVLSVPVAKIEAALRILERVPEIEGIETGYVPAGRGKHGLISSNVLETIASMRLSPIKTKQLLKLAHKEELSGNDVRVIGKLMASGMPFEEAVRERDNYIPKTATVFVRKEIFRESGIQYWNDHVRAILRGEKEPIRNLVY